MLLVTEISGFKSNSDYVLIYTGINPFYYKTNTTGTLTFNMPPGAYSVLYGDLVKLDKPLVYDIVAKYEKDYPNSDIPKLKIIVSKNPNKCTIDLKAATATIDPELARRPLYQVVYIIGHEYAHNLYRGKGQLSERACDNMGAIAMLKTGFNPSQCCAGIEGALSDNHLACIRKSEMYYEMKKLN